MSISKLNITTLSAMSELSYVSLLSFFVRKYGNWGNVSKALILIRDILAYFNSGYIRVLSSTQYIAYS